MLYHASTQNMPRVHTYVCAHKSSSLVTVRDHRPRACFKFVPREVSRGRPKLYRSDCVRAPANSREFSPYLRILTCLRFSRTAPDDRRHALRFIHHTAMVLGNEISSSFTQHSRAMIERRVGSNRSI